MFSRILLKGFRQIAHNSIRAGKTGENRILLNSLAGDIRCENYVYSLTKLLLGCQERYCRILGKNCLSSVVMETCHLLDIKELNMTAYHPQTDGLIEQFNGILAQSLSMHISKDQKDWDRHYSYGLICLSHFSIRHHWQIANFPFV